MDVTRGGFEGFRLLRVTDAEDGSSEQGADSESDVSRMPQSSYRREQGTVKSSVMRDSSGMPLKKDQRMFTPHGNVIIWRYMDFARFVQLLETKTLWFARADQFEDPFERSYTDAEIATIEQHADVSEQNIRITAKPCWDRRL